MDFFEKTFLFIYILFTEFKLLYSAMKITVYGYIYITRLNFALTQNEEKIIQSTIVHICNSFVFSFLNNLIVDAGRAISKQLSLK